MSKRAKILELLGSLIVSVLLGASLSLIIVSAMGLTAPALWVYAFSLGVALLISVGLWSRAGAFIAGGVALVALFIWALSPARPLLRLGALFSALADYVAGGQVMLSEHAVPIALSLTLLLTLCIHWMSTMPGGVYPALTLSIIVMMGGWLVSKSLSGPNIIPAAAALATMFARSPDDKLPYVRALPAGVLAAVLAFLLLPAGNPTWQPLKDTADKVRQMFYDYFLFTETRVTYSLYPEGFQPQGEPLGGPATPNEGEVMLVTTDSPLLLRGSIKRTYTGYSWTNSAINNRYLFVDPTKRATRDAIFDSARISEDRLGNVFKRVDADVVMLAEGISTYFVPHRLQDLSTSADAAVYYNSSGEVFITRSVQPGDAYSFGALIPSGKTKETDLLLSELAQQSDPMYDLALSDYTTLPHGIESGVYELARKTVEGAKTPYQKAQRLQQLLMTKFNYNMDVPYPPQNRDFVSYFLLDSKEGYCSYFASAMTVMARIAGLPARYIEGYMVKPEYGEKIVTGRNAHAWVEIYFKGVGWVSFNPTPGDGETEQIGGKQSEDEGNSAPPDQTEPPEETPPPEEGDQPEETPPPDDGTDEQDEQQDDTGDETEQDQQPDEQPPDENTDDTEDQPSGGEDGQNGGSRSLWWLYMLLALAAAGGVCYLVWRRLDSSNPAKLTRKAQSPDDKIAIWYRALLLVLAQQGQTPGASESPEQFALRLKDAGLAGDPFVYLCRQVNRNRYAKKRPESIAFKQAAQAYQAQVKALRPLEKLNWYKQRLMRGLGDMTQIP